MATELATLPQAALTPMDLLQMAVSQGADLNKLEKLMDLKERWEAQEAKKAFVSAMIEFKRNAPDIRKNKQVKFGNTSYKHATLDNVSDLIGEALGRVGISHRWETEQPDGQVVVTCVLTHALGHSERTTMRGGADNSGSKNSIQAIASAVTYLRRYTLLCAVGMAEQDTDNDGQGASRMDEDRIAAALDEIEAALTMEELQKFFTAAYKAAEAAKDRAAMKVFINAKDKQKEAIRANS